MKKKKQYKYNTKEEILICIKNRNIPYSIDINPKCLDQEFYNEIFGLDPISIECIPYKFQTKEMVEVIFNESIYSETITPIYI